MLWRDATRDDLGRLWPACRSARVAASLAELKALSAAAPWRIRTNDAGDAMVLQPWRDHLSILSLRAAWAPPSRLIDLVADARATADAQRYRELLSPLVAVTLFAPYERAGMSVRERIVALQAALATIAPQRAPEVQGVRLRAARRRDLEALVALDALCFDDFWRYGAAELASVLASEGVTVAESSAGIVGYATVWMGGSSASLGRLAVAPGARRSGIGTALVDDAVARARSSGALGVSVCTQTSNVAARALYRTMGFSEVEEEYRIGACATAGAQAAR